MTNAVGLENIMAEYTDEQLTEMLAKAKEGLFTEDELKRRVDSETDRRVESGIQKGLETHKAKWESEYLEKSKLTADELAKKQLEELTSQLSEKERTVLKKANTLDAKEMLAEAGIPKANYEPLLAMLVSDSEESTKANVTGFIGAFNSTKLDLETRIKAEISKIPPPNTDPNNKSVTKTDFDKMGFAEKVTFKAENPELYREFMK